MLRLWFGFTDAVGRKPYLLTGVGLMALKYLLDVGLVYAVTGVVWRPFDYLNPIISMRLAEIRDAPSWLFAVLAVMTLPFMWIGASMSVRRAVDVGASAWVGIGFLVPFLNFLVMIGLAAFPSKGGATWSPRPTTVFRAPGEQPEVPLQVDIGLRAALLGVAAAVGVGLSMVFLSVYGLGTYGMTLFFMTPFVMGAVSAYLFNRPAPRPTGNTLLVAVASTLIAGTALLLFALEGIICLVMAVPIAMVIALLGALIGRAVATRTRTPIQHTAAMMLALPGIAGVEAQVGSLPVHEVRSAIEIEAPPEAVWPNVIGFSELPPPAEWVFSTGISYPMRARIEGEGVGAVRYCEFSTGPFVEPITAWEPPRRLAFDVSAQPPSMKEWSPFRHVHPPHLDSGLRSQRGEFRLIALPGGRTRLEGSTWYTLSLFPALYWKAWSDELLHRIHGRVLAHVKRLSEEGAGAVTGR
ncbi:Hypothetical protein CAP_5903 [Chondromyces apiculatus DSM 436]|uniref:DUF805 domain-containing protein n=1 Tax=Chondromyces apiculatus DSM 436 TaxID=1192034 RepID=A0A017TFT2_9BACT|nr:Hypothetical protein CAP_5903 [Chondromyces apiculatus DSM 436]